MALRLLFMFLAICVIQIAQGMDCSLGRSENVLEKILTTCPSPVDVILGAEDKAYCCYSYSAAGDGVKCCTLADYVMNSIYILSPVIVVVLAVSVACCLCCYFARGCGGRHGIIKTRR